ncbi:MAG TPA: carboxylesterase/lipase family protein [Silvibacterium sp.]|nr:carboxylesterase/lipase family protein [Silvibacterium sp.]
MKSTIRLVLALAMALPFAAHASNPLQIKTDKGKVRGALTPDGEVRAFKGIPYAAPPVGPLRWQPTQPAAKWKGVRDATQFGSRCMQAPIYEDMVFRDPGPSEDCLTLNVWTPAKVKKGSLPVMVWIFGGGYMAGGTSEPRQDGQFLAHRDVVVVSMNYRLGIFGFFVHPALTAESPHHASGNYGLMDQNAALEWVQKNIANFGGDPHNVTIFGESAGSMSVSLLMASPLSQNRFHKAIGESGGPFFLGNFRFKSREVQEQRDAEFAQSAFGASTLDALRKIPAAELLDAATKLPRESSIHFGPDVDGWFLPQPASEIFTQGKQAHVPLLAGWNADDLSADVLLPNPASTAEGFKAQAEAKFGPDAQEFLTLYPAGTDADAVKSVRLLAGDDFLVFSTWKWLEEQVKTGDAPVYRYRFDLGGPGDKFHPASIGAFHSDDIEYVFGTLDSRPDAHWRPEDRALSHQMQQYWTNFARTGDPNGGALSSNQELPKWPTYNAADQWQVMHLNATSASQPDAERPRFLFLEKMWSRMPATNQR